MVDAVDIPDVHRKSFENEIKELTEVCHQNIVKLHGYCLRKGAMYLVYEYLKRGSLGKGIAHALAYLHQEECRPPILHRYIMVNNILLDSNFEPRISDFGTAKLLDPGSTNWTLFLPLPNMKRVGSG
ncbi:putative LRR receptor-like serine/threonine-protein kinase [Dendrobium catenatum]|uniref:non-specific serine/threonine protein kinase n=1 Tax=Dendrobium catenatum TaxID=906689 RepID=A0A2I0WI84_9ASPA|nr:putative LRR receptor-like serine/threonine-protein kinase [Dendrobium catenatum]